MASNAANPGFRWDTRNNKEALGELDEGGVPRDAALKRDDQGDIDWLSTARQAAASAEQYMSSNLRARWSRAYRAFQSRHYEGSKYLSKRYRGRTSLFRPKTRMAVRKSDAQAAAAFFTTEDIVQIGAENDSDDFERAGAALHHELLNIRLDRANTNYGLPWFLTVMGAHQDSKVTGVCCSKQWWKFKEEETGEMEEFIDPKTGQVYTEAVMKATVNRPDVTLFPAENVLRDPAADWIDQANMSSFIILKYPMSVGDVRAKMKSSGDVNQGGWKEAPDNVIMKAMVNTENASVRRSREGRGLDRMDNQYSQIRNFDTVWVHENFIRIDGVDHHFWTLKDTFMLTDPRLVAEVYPEQHGRRPIVIGYGNIEAHKTDPQSNVEAIQPLQQEVNDVVNLQLDATKTAINPVTKVRRGKMVDISQVQNRSADSLIYVKDPEDVTWEKLPPPDGAAYANMDRLNVDIDELTGSFSGSSVQSNRSMNETVGGMNLLSSSADTVSELDLRVFNETWMEPVLRQLANLNAYYENDERILTIAGAKAGVWPQYTQEMAPQLDDLMMTNVQVRVDAGTGASDPMKKIQKLRMGAETIAMALSPERAASMVNAEEIIQEVMGTLGYKDGARFYNIEGPDPQVQELESVLEEMQMALEDAGKRIEELEMNAEDGQADRDNQLKLQEMKSAADLTKVQMQQQGEAQKIAIQSQLQGADLVNRALQSQSTERQNAEKLRSTERQQLTSLRNQNQQTREGRDFDRERMQFDAQQGAEQMAAQRQPMI